MSQVKAYKKLEQSTVDARDKMQDPTRLINRLNKSLSPSKSATSLFLSSQKMYDPKKLNLTLNDDDRKAQAANPNYTTVEDYYEFMWSQENLSLKAKYQAEQYLRIQRQQFATAVQKKQVKVKAAREELDDSMIVMENEYENIRQLQEQIVLRDINDFERTRKELALKLVDVEQELGALRLDQVAERRRIEQVRHELTQKLLYIEDRINALRRSLVVERRNHHFSSNQALHNSQLELSQISIQHHYLQKWENDPEQEKIRRDFVEKQMQEWKLTKKKFKERVRLLEKELRDEELRIKKQQEELEKAKTEEKRKEITKYLEELKVIQEKRRKEWEEANERYQKKKSERTLAQRYAEKDAAFMAMIKKEREDKLEEIKQQNRPFDLEQVNQHDRDFLQTLNEKEEQRKHKIEQRAAEWNTFRAQYFSENYRKAQDDMKLNKNPLEDQHKKAQEKLERTKRYQELIKEEFKPAKNKDKEAEMKFQALKAEIKQVPDFNAFKDLAKKVKLKRKFDGIDKKKINHKQKLKPLSKKDLPQPPSPRAVGQIYLDNNGRYNKKHFEKSKSPQKNEIKSQPVETVATLPISQSAVELPKLRKNYLKEIREKKIIKSRDILHDWEKITTESKLRDEKLMEEARKIEDVLSFKNLSVQLAKRKQEVIKARNGAEQLAEDKLVDELLVNSIKAKLEVLKHPKAKVTMNDKN